MRRVLPSPDVATLYRCSVEKIRDSIFEHSHLVFGLAGLRDRGPDADHAVEAALEIPELAVLKVSWELVVAFVESDDGDPEELFTDVFGERLYERARFALFGEPF